MLIIVLPILIRFPAQQIIMNYVCYKIVLALEGIFLKNSTLLGLFPKETTIHFSTQFSRADLFIFKEYLQFLFLTKLMKVVEII